MTILSDSLARLIGHLRTDAAANNAGWHNETTGLGTTLDKSTDWKYKRPADWTVDELSDLYETDSLARRATGAVVDDGLRQGFTLGDPDEWDAWRREADTLFDFSEVLAQLLKESRLYGGVLLVPMLADISDLRLPVAAGPREVRSIQWVEPDGALPVNWEKDPLSSQFQQPNLWNVQLRALAGGVSYIETLHSSRVRPILGGVWTRRGRAGQKQKYPFWPTSTLASVLNGIRLYRGAMSAISALISDASQGVYKFQGLRSILTNGEDGAERLREWIWARDLIRSAINAIVLDAGTEKQPAEDFTRVATPMSEMADLVDRFQALVSEATGVPITRLFGQAPSGLSTDDKSGTRMWFDSVQSWRSSKAEPLIRDLVAVLSRDPRLPDAPEGEIEWPSLWQFAPDEAAQAKLTTAQSDQIYLNTGVVQPEDVALTRVKPDGWRDDLRFDETTFDVELPKELPAADDAPSNVEETNAVGAKPTGESEPTVGGDLGTVGARATAVTQLVEKVVAKEIPRETAATLLNVLFGFEPAVVERLLGPPGFQPPSEEPPGAAPSE